MTDPSHERALDSIEQNGRSQKDSAEILRATEERFRAVFDTLPSPCAIYDADRRFRAVNAAMTRFLRRPADKIIGRRDEEIMPAQYTDIYLPLLHRALETRDSQSAECTFTGPLGTFYFITQYAPILDEAGCVREVLGISYDITQQKRVEQEVRQRDAEIRSLTENVPDIIARMNREGRHLYVNRRIEEVTGISAETFLNKTDRELGMPEALLETWDLWRGEVFDTGRTVENEFAYYGKSGVQYFESRFIPEFAADGTVETALTITRDISASKMARLRLAESEERYRLVVEDQTETICRFLADYSLTFANEVYCRLFGKNSAELVGTRWHPQVFAEDLPLLLDRLHQLSPENPVVVVENRVIAANKEVRWMQFVNRAFFDASGRLVETQSVGRDITERKLAQAALSESESRFRTAFESIPVGMFMLDGHLRLQQANRAMCEMLGYTEDELIGRSPYDFTHPDDIPAGRERTIALLRGEISHYTREKRHLAKGGRIVWGRLTTTVIRDHRGEPYRFIGVIEDITERRLAEVELARHREHLEELVASRTRALEASQQTLRSAERLASLGTLAAGIAHEINNPVGTIMLAAEMAAAAQAGNDTEMLLRCLEGIKADAQRCGRIVKNVLHFARQEATEKWPYALHDVVRQAMERTRAYAADRNTVLTLALDESVGKVLMNPLAVEQALTNVLRNAVESQPKDRLVRVVTAASDGDYTITISDNGLGMAAEVLRHIFDPFFTMRRSTGGMGLGLSLVHGTITDNGGRVHVESAVGQGTTVTIDLPRYTNSPAS